MALFKMTSSIPRIIAAVLLAVEAAVLFTLFPGIFTQGLTGFSPPLAWFMPFFLAMVICCLLLDVAPVFRRIAVPLKGALLLLCIFLLLYATELLGGSDIGYFLAERRFVLFLGFCYIFFMTAFFYGVTGKPSLALIITALLIAAYSYANYFIFRFRGTPFQPWDIAAVGTAWIVLPQYAFTLTQQVAESILIFSGILLAAPALDLPGPRPSYSGMIRCGALAFSLLCLLTTSSRWYMEYHSLAPAYWDQRISAASNGSLVNFIANIVYAFPRAPEGYDASVAAGIAAGYPSDTSAEARSMPDVVLVLGESWADLAPKGLARTNMPVISFLSGLRDKENATYGNLIVSTVGGSTSIPEFQVLTGTSTEYGMHAAPFQFHANAHIPSLVDQFKKLGYQTTAVHTGNAKAWGREAAFSILGFDHYYAADELQKPNSKKLRGLLSDEVLYDRALGLLKDADKPQFLYLITMQTHGGYVDGGYVSPVRIEHPRGRYPQAEQYLGLMRESDKDFANFIAELEKRRRPIVVLAYGDHTPAVEYEYLRKAVKPRHRFGDYQTFYVLWANHPLPGAVLNHPGYLSLNYLNPYLMQAAGLPLTGYQKFLIEAAGQFPVVSAGGFITAEDEFVPISKARQMPLYYRQHVLQYNLIYDREHMVKSFFELR